MPRMAVNSIDTIIEAQSKWLAEGSEEHVARSITGKRTGGTRGGNSAGASGRIRREIEEVVCSATWARRLPLPRGAENMHRILNANVQFAGNFSPGGAIRGAFGNPDISPRLPD